jgi:hypothetical protein
MDQGGELRHVKSNHRGTANDSAGNMARSLWDFGLRETAERMYSLWPH